jgi:hypothetical protein
MHKTVVCADLWEKMQREKAVEIRWHAEFHFSSRALRPASR